MFWFLAVGQIKIHAACPEEYGVVFQETFVYAVANSWSTQMGKIMQGTPIEIISILENYTLIRQENGQYGYISNSAFYIDADYEKLYGKKGTCWEHWDVLETDGQLYRYSVEALIESYLRIPEVIPSCPPMISSGSVPEFRINFKVYSNAPRSGSRIGPKE